MSTSKQFITSRGIIVTGWMLLLFIGVSIIATSLYLWATDRTPPEILINWGGTVLGFFFGSFVGLLKDFLNNNEDTQR